MEMVTISGESRTQRGTRASRALRETGRIPGIIYGHGEAPEAVSLLLHDVELALSHHARMIKLKVGGQAKQYLIKDVQYDHFDHIPLHVDLFRVSMDERVRVKVGIEFRGTPKGAHEGGMLDQFMPEIEVECLPADIPDTFHPVVLNLEVGDSLYVRDIEVTPGVTLLANPDERIAAVRIKAGAEAEETTDVEEQEAQPEVIGRGKKEEEESSTGKG